MMKSKMMFNSYSLKKKIKLGPKKQDSIKMIFYFQMNQSCIIQKMTMNYLQKLNFIK